MYNPIPTSGGRGMDHSMEEPPFEFSDYTQRVIVAALIVVISLVGIVGNATVQLAVLLSKKLRTPTNAFVVNLSVADLLTCIVLPCNTVALLNKADPPINEWVCKVVAIIQFTTVGCSIFNLASIALNRWVLITRSGAVYRKIYTPRKISLWLMLNWLIPLVVSLSPPLAGVGAVGYNRQYHFCGSLSTHPLYTIYNIILAVSLYPLPLITIIISYILIWKHLRRQSKRLVKSSAARADKYIPSDNVVFTVTESSENPAVRNQITLPDTSRSVSSSRGSASATNRQAEVTKNMAYVVCGFGLCLTPYAINLTFDSNGPGIPYTTAVLLLNNCINPFIYATKHRDFKAVFGCIWRRRWRLIPEPSDFLKALMR